MLTPCTLPQRAASAGAPAVPAAAAGEPPLGLEEEAALLKYYGSRLQHVCRELRLPRRVLGTAITYLKVGAAAVEGAGAEAVTGAR